jgi:hypothetical protein
LVSARNIAIYAVVAAPLLASVGSSILRESDDFKRIINFDLRLQRVDERLIGYIWPLVSIMLVGWILLSGAKLDFNGAGNEFSKEVFPVEAVDWISEQPENGPVFNYFPWGGYLLYRSWPQQQVFIDGQTDFYGESLTRQYEKVITLSAGWQEILDQYHIRWLIMPTDSELARALNDHPEWEQKYLDETAAIYFAIP